MNLFFFFFTLVLVAQVSGHFSDQIITLVTQLVILSKSVPMLSAPILSLHNQRFKTKDDCNLLRTFGESPKHYSMIFSLSFIFFSALNNASTYFK